MNSNDKHASRQMQELMQRNQILEAQIAEQAVQISGLNEQLQSYSHLWCMRGKEGGVSC